MGKRLFLLLIGGLIGVVMSPRALIAADRIEAQQPDFDAVETVELPVEKPVEAKTISVPAPKQIEQVKQPVNYTVTVYAPEMVAHGLSYSDIYKTGKLLYAHNSGNLFGGLGGLNIGEVFYVTEPGGTKAYQVATKVLYNKTADGYLNNDPYLMGNIVYTAMGHDLALMTCAGVSYGNGDASQRLVVFAKAM